MRKNFRKSALAAMVAAAVAVGSYTAIPATPAEAGFGLGDIGKIAGIGGGGQVDIEGLTGRQNDLLTKLGYSTLALSMARDDIQEAVGLGEATEDLEAGQAILSNAQGDAGELTSFSKERLDSFGSKEDRKAKSAEIQGALQEVIDSGDEERLRNLDAVVKRAKTERLVSDGIVAAAAVDVVKIIKDAGSGIKSGGDLADQFQQIMDTAKAAQQLLKVRSDVSSMLKTATKNYEKTRKIGEPSKEEKKAAEQSIRPE